MPSDRQLVDRAVAAEQFELLEESPSAGSVAVKPEPLESAGRTPSDPEFAERIAEHFVGWAVGKLAGCTPFDPGIAASVAEQPEL